MTGLTLAMGVIFPIQVSAQSDYEIGTFTSEIHINQDTSILVKETIVADFEVLKHGIFRIIPVKYRSGNTTIDSRLHIKGVKDESGRSYKYSTSRNGDSIELKIGDPDTTIIGRHVYVIEYLAKNVVRKFDDHVELYWNVTGGGWDTAIDAVFSYIQSPFASIQRAECFGGVTGTQERNCIVMKQTERDAWISSSRPMGSGKDLTVVLGMDTQNQLVWPNALESWWDSDGPWVLWMLLPAVIMGVVWFTRGRDYKYKGDNIYYAPQDGKTQAVNPFHREHLPMVYSPIKGLTPAEAGTILDMQVDLADVTAEIVELARLGFIKIFRMKVDKPLLPDGEDYIFVKMDKKQVKLKDHQEFLLENLFASSYHATAAQLEKVMSVTEAAKYISRSALLSKMKGKFHTDLETFRTKLYKNLTQEGQFEGRPDTTKILWMVAGGMMTGLFFMVAMMNLAGNMVVVTAVISGIMAMLFGWFMSRRSAKGHALYRQLVGLKYFVGKGKWRYDIAEKNLFLEEILPLAISLGIIKQLTRDMKGLEIPPPAYMGNMVYSDFGRFGSNVGRTLSVTPSGSRSGWSGGSGFSGGSSGGGFGGGGGGSW